MLRGLLFAIAGWLVLPLGAALAQEQAVDLELILAVDVSLSIDLTEAEQQRDGYLDALTHPAVLAAIQQGPHGRIAVSYVEWAGRHHQRVLVAWRVIKDEASAEAFTEILRRAPLATHPSTSISALIDFAVRSFARNGYAADRRVLDISGDGPNSDGRWIKDARDAALAQGVTINGLPILNDRPNPLGGAPMTNLDGYYRDNVVGGPGSFLIQADSFSIFAPVVLKKLIREIAATSAVPIQSAMRHHGSTELMAQPRTPLVKPQARR